MNQPITIKIESKINQQLAHCFAAHGDDPDKLMWKLHQLVIDRH